MSRTAEAFRHGKALIAFLTAGDPSLEDSVRYVKRLVEGGADLVEIGVPFSDPIADGPVIMDADVRALNNHVHLPQVLEEVIAIRKEGVNVPIVLLTYYNPVFNYGVDAFFASCERIGIDGVIIPDLPFEEQGEVRPAADEHGVDIIQMVAPTSEDRIRRNVKNATGFVYVVSSMGVTGMRSEIETDLDHMMKIIRETTDVPAAIGFGIHTPEQARAMAEKADGVITGSGVVNIIGEHGDKADEALKEYVSGLKEAIRF
jgi:tryptophan synthase alpha chain